MKRPGQKKGRPRINPTWDTLQPVPPFPVKAGEEPLRTWANNTYVVLEFELASTTAGEPPLTHLLVRRHDHTAVHDWRHLQRVKNDVCGPEREAIEIFPAESRLVDTSNQFHLWVLPAGEQVPFGYPARMVAEGPGQRPMPPEDPPGGSIKDTGKVLPRVNQVLPRR